MTDLATRTRAARIAVAERKGWTEITTSNDGDSPWGCDEHKSFGPLPDYPTDPRAYMPLLEEMRKAGHDVDLACFKSGVCRASIHALDMHKYADTPGLAICEAWVAWDESREVADA
jgi:hypothetical protein